MEIVINKSKLSLYSKFFKENWLRILLSSVIIWIALLFYSSSHRLSMIFIDTPIFSIIMGTVFYMEKAKLPCRVLIYLCFGFLLGILIYLSGVEPKSFRNNILAGVILALLLPLFVRGYLWIKSKVGDIWI